MKNVVIIGGMAAGCKAAARLKRLEPDYNVTVIEKKSFLSYGACGMPLFASGDVDGFLDLAKTPWGVVRDETFFKEVKGVNALTNTLAVSVDKENHTVKCKNLINEEEFELKYDYLMIASGAEAMKPRFPVPVSENISTFHNPLDAKTFRQKAQTGQVGSAIIIGGGFIGVELAEAMVSLWGIETQLIEREDRLLPFSLGVELSKVLESKFEANDIKLHLSSTVEKIELDGDGNPVVVLDNGENLSADYVFLCMGVKPAVKMAESLGLEIGSTGAIKVDTQMRTSEANIWAAGDCIETTNLISVKPGVFPLGSLANRQGKVVAESMAGQATEFKGAAGAISVKVFDLVTACSGLTEYAAKEAGYDFDKVIGSWYDRPEYHPDVKTIFGKLLYEKKTMKLLGLQLSGRGEVTRYIDTFTSIASNNGTAYGLLNVEHAYTPPHSGPMNPLNNLGAMALAQDKDGIKCLSGKEVTDFKGQYIDVREANEIAAYPFGEPALEYNMNVYRQHLGELDQDKPVMVVCQKGPRSYEAARTLLNKGFKSVCYLGGGVQLQRLVVDEE